MGWFKREPKLPPEVVGFQADADAFFRGTTLERALGDCDLEADRENWSYLRRFRREIGSDWRMERDPVNRRPTMRLRGSDGRD
jgi:hypothetical protein